MTNRWTGDHDAALAITTAGIDRLLAAQHADGSLFHRQWLPLPLDGDGPDDAVRGNLGTAVSTPTVGVPDDPRRDLLAVSFDLRGYLLAHPESPPAPERVHGRLTVEAPIDWTADDGEALVEVDFRSARTGVDWRPADGSPFATDADGLVVRREARRALRDNVRQVQQRFELPSLGIRHSRLRTYPASGDRPAGVGLLLDFADRPHTDGDHLAPESFLADGEVALALGAELIDRVARQQAADVLAGFQPVLTVDLGLHTVGYRVVPDLDSLAARLVDGVLRIGLSGRAVTGSSVAPDLDFSVAQDFSLALSGDRLLVAPSGGASVELRHDLLPDFALNFIERRVEDDLEAPMRGVGRQASEALSAALAPLDRLLAGLGMPGHSARLRDVSLDDDAVVVRADLELPPLPAPVVRFTAGLHRGDGGRLEAELRAQPSWIPGGTIGHYRWALTRTDGRLLREVVDPHGFVLRLPLAGGNDPLVLGGAWPPAAWCLEVEGTQASPFPGGRPVTVRGAVCPVPIPASGGPDTHPPLVVDVTGGGSSDGGGPTVVGGLTVSFGFRRFGVPVLVFHGGSGGDATEESADALDKALLLAADGGVQAIGAALRRIDRGAKRHRRALASAVDPEGRWAKAAGVEAGTAVLYGRDGKEAWRGTAPFEPDQVAGRIMAAGEKEAVPALSLATVAVRQGEEPPELTVRHLGRWMPLRKLAGRRLAVCFWAPWNEAAVAELASRVEDEKNGGPRVIAIHPEGNAKAIASALGDVGLEKLASRTDRGSKIARAWGVRVWPTTVIIGRDGRVSAVAYGRRSKK